MKRKLLALTVILSLSLVLGACGKKATSDSASASSTETSTVSETSASDTETSSTESSVSEPDTSVEVVKEGGDAEGQVTGNLALYEGFLNGTEKAVVTESGDHCSYYSFTKAMTAGEAYTLDEIIANLKSFMKDNGWEKEPTLGEINSEYIDCGADGKKELHVSIDLPVENIEDFVIDMIVVDKSGKLVIAFAGDSWSRSTIYVDESGVITSGGSDGAASIVFNTSFVNAAGDYVFGYVGKTATIVEPTDFYLGYTTDVTKVDLSGLNTEGLMIEVVSFNEQPTAAETYIMLYDGYADEEAEDPSVYAEDDPIRKAFEGAGFKIVTEDELTEAIAEKLKEKGLE